MAYHKRPMIRLDEVTRDEQPEDNNEQVEDGGLGHAVYPHMARDYDMHYVYGITYQKCGGGRRVIRRGGGNYN